MAEVCLMFTVKNTEMAKQKLFTKGIDDMLFAQYKFGSDFDKQKVVCKIFNPYGDGTWYIMNSDPEDPDYLWAIVKMFGNVEVGSVSRNELQAISFFGLNLGLERDISFTPTNAKQLYEGLLKGEHFANGGEITLFDDYMRAYREDYDDINDYLAAFSSLEEAKQYAINNQKKYKVIVFLDAYGDSIYVDRNDTKEDIDFLFSTEYAKGGKIGFKGLSEKVAARYKGKKVPAKYQSEYGKTYDAEEAKEVGNKVAAKVYRQQLAKKKFARGGNTSDQPKIYVEELIAHKEGLDDGEWIILTDYNDGDEIMDAINDLLEEWSEKYGEERDEYIVTAYENFSEEYYDKFMDETQFDEILEEFNKGGNLEEISEEKDIPVDVLEQIIADFDPSDLREWIDDNYYGYFNSERELAEEYVQSIGGLSQLSTNTLEYHFDYDGFGSDLASDYSEYDGYYFRNYKRGGVMPKHELNKYLKKKVKTNTP